MPNRTPPPRETTQQRHPWRATFRTAFAVAIGFIPVGTLLIYELELDSIPFFAAAIGLGAAVTRVLAMPDTGKFIKNYLPWLHEEPYRGRHRKEDRENDLL